MMRRAEPLVVDVFVAALAGVGLHEELAGDFLPAVNLGRTGEERAFGTVAFSIHVVGRHRGIQDAASRLPTLTHVMRAVAYCGQQREGKGGAEGGRVKTVDAVA